MPTVVYTLCLLTSLLCAVLLLRNCGADGAPGLLFWSGLSFLIFAISNALMILDLLVLHEIDLAPARAVTAFLSVGLLLYGLVWDGE